MTIKLRSFLAHAIIAALFNPLITALPMDTVEHVFFRGRPNILTTVTTVGSGSPVCSKPHCREPIVPNNFKTALFLEDFSTYLPGSQPSTDKWNYSLGYNYPGGEPHWGTKEVEYNTDSTDNVVITSNRTLRITPTFDPNSHTWFSSRIESTAPNDFACTPGQQLLIQGSILLRSGFLPNQQLGIWPAFWLIGSGFRDNPRGWPSVGEVDILETVNGYSRNWNTVHCGVSPGGPCHEKFGVGNQGSTPLTRDEWHIVGVRIDRTHPDGDWRGETITWMIDHVDTYEMNAASINDEAGWKAIIRNSKYFILNVAVGGEMPDGLSGLHTPTKDTKSGVDASMEVEWTGAWST